MLKLLGQAQNHTELAKAFTEEILKILNNLKTSKNLRQALSELLEVLKEIEKKGNRLGTRLTNTKKSLETLLRPDKGNDKFQYRIKETVTLIDSIEEFSKSQSWLGAITGKHISIMENKEVQEAVIKLLDKAKKRTIELYDHAQNELKQVQSDLQQLHNDLKKMQSELGKEIKALESRKCDHYDYMIDYEKEFAPKFERNSTIDNTIKRSPNALILYRKGKEYSEYLALRILAGDIKEVIPQDLGKELSEKHPTFYKELFEKVGKHQLELKKDDDYLEYINIKKALSAPHFKSAYLQIKKEILEKKKFLEQNEKNFKEKETPLVQKEIFLKAGLNQT